MDLLEKRISDLLGRLESLEGENRRLNAKLVQDLETLLAENQHLKVALQEERENKAAVLRRIDALLARLKDQSGEG